MEGSIARPKITLRDIILTPLRLLRKFVIFVERSLFLNNKKNFYGIFFANDFKLSLLIKNLLNPKKYFGKLIYGQTFPYVAISGQPSQVKNASDSIQQKVDAIKKDGYIFLPQKFTKEAEQLTQTHKEFIDTKKPAEDYYENAINEFDKALLNVATDKEILEIFSVYYNRQPYMRFEPNLMITYPSFSCTTSQKTYDMGLYTMPRRFNPLWHTDTVNQVLAFLFLEDCHEDGTHMKVVKGQHRRHWANLDNLDSYFSDEYLSSKFDIISCVGKKGDVFLMDSQTIHKCYPVKDSRRIFVQVAWTPGNDNLINKLGTPDVKAISPELLSSLNPMQKESLRFWTETTTN